jgi:serine protease
LYSYYEHQSKVEEVRMKRFVVAALAAVLSFSAVAEEAQRYLVATRPAARVRTLEMLQRVQLDPETAAVRDFKAFDGFAATLSREQVDQLRASGQVRWIEPVIERKASWIGFQSIPWGIRAVHAVQAHEAVPQGTVNVVVIDTGVDGGHPDLVHAYAGGWNFFTKNQDPVDVHGHGTHVAGTIAAADNGNGVVGVAPNVRLWAVKVLGDDGYGSNESLIGGIDWVVQQKAALGGNWIANLSLGSDVPSDAEREAFGRAADAGILIFAAAGNDSSDVRARPVGFPAAYPGVFAVGATTELWKRAHYSNQGPELAFAAPGSHVLSTSPRGNSFLAYVKTNDRVFISSVLRGSKIGSVTSEYVVSGLGKPGEFPASVAGKIALMKRGEITFMEKTRNAKAAGAVAVAIYNYDDSGTSWTLLADDEASSEEWPIAIALSQEEGERLAASGSGTITLGMENNAYRERTGTSMATPHVAGAAAFLWSLAPDAPRESILNAMRVTAGDLGDPGPDPLFGAGAIDLLAAARLLAPNAYTSSHTGRNLLRRGRP